MEGYPPSPFFLLEKTMMEKHISDKELLSDDSREHRWRRDRKDTYIMCGETLTEYSMGRNLLYAVCEVNCDPDFDF